MMNLLAKLNVLDDLQREGKVSQKNVDPKKTDETEVAQHTVQRANAVFTHDLPVHRIKGMKHVHPYVTYAISSADFPCC